MNQLNNFQIDMGDGYIFLFMLGGDEINGMIKDDSGVIVEGSCGWYRTDDPMEAAKRAAFYCL